MCFIIKGPLTIFVQITASLSEWHGGFVVATLMKTNLTDDCVYVLVRQK